MSILCCPGALDLFVSVQSIASFDARNYVVTMILNSQSLRKPIRPAPAERHEMSSAHNPAVMNACFNSLRKQPLANADGIKKNN
jgi:hypothetical protein